MEQITQQTKNEGENPLLLQILQLLEESYSDHKKRSINEINLQLKTIYEKDFVNYLNCLFSALSLTSIQNNQIPLNLHKSLAIHIKNLVLEKIGVINDQEIFYLCQKILDLFLLSNQKNKNLCNPTIMETFTIIFENLCNLQVFAFEFYEKIFNRLVSTLLSTNDNKSYPNVGNIVVIFITKLFLFIRKDHIQMFIKYYLPLFDAIFNKISTYINPSQQIYDNEYIILLKNLIGGLYDILNKYFSLNEKQINMNELKQILYKIYEKYSLIIFELFKFTVPCDEEFQNTLLLFDMDENKFKEINLMKVQCIKFFSFCAEIFAEKSNNDEKTKILNNEKVSNSIAELIKLIINALEKILNNNQQYTYIKNYLNFSINPINKYIDKLLYNFVSFLTKVLFIEPIKSFFDEHMKNFILNIIFPLIISTNEENKLITEVDPLTYNYYLNSVLNDFDNAKIFRASLCFLLQKICLNNEYYKNFILSYTLEMLKYIISENKIQNDINYNIYTNEKNISLINGANVELKIDFCFLVILTIKNSLIKNKSLLKQFYNILNDNQNKIHQINSLLIRVKLCKIYEEFMISFLKIKNIINYNYFPFFEKAIKFLIENYLIQNMKNSNHEILILVASEAIYCLSSSLNRNEKNENNKKLKEFLNNELTINFKNLIDIIDQYPNQVFNNAFLKIISDTEIENHPLKLAFLEKLTNKFIYLINKSNENDFRNTNFVNDYFIIINHYLTDKNKFNLNETENFGKILDLLLKEYSEKPNCDFSLQLIIISTHYLNNLNKINERSLTLLKYIKKIIDEEGKLRLEIYGFLSQILVHVKKDFKKNDINSINYNIGEIIETIINIIKYCITLPDDYCLSNKKYSLLLFLKIFCFYYDKISYENLEYFFSKMDELDKNNYGEKDAIDQILQISLAIYSLAFIHLSEDAITKCFGKIIKEIAVKYLNLLYMSLDNYNPILIKCVILGMCFIVKNKNIFNCILKSEEQKKNFLYIFFQICFKLRISQLQKIRYLTKDDILGNFVENDDNINYENEKIIIDITEDRNNELNENLKDIFNENENLVECDEYYCYYEAMNWLKKHENKLFNYFISSITEKEILLFKELIIVRNVKVEYKGKEYLVPRKTVKIKRNGN